MGLLMGVAEEREKERNRELGELDRRSSRQIRAKLTHETNLLRRPRVNMRID